MNVEAKMKRIMTVVLILASVGIARAQEFNLPPGKWWENERLATHIGLTEAQREQIQTLVYEHAHRMIDLNANIKKAELELANLVANSDFEAAAARSAFAGLQHGRRALESERFEMLLAVRGVLTSEQWQAIQEVRRRIRQNREQDGPGGQRPRFGNSPPPPDGPGL